MPGYGVETADWRPLPWTWAAERLVAGRNFWLVTVSSAGAPHAMPVWGVWDDGDLQFAFSCGPRSRKASNLAANSNVVVTTEDTVEALSIEGRAAPVEGERQDVWIARYLAKYTALAPELSAEFIRQNLLFEVVPSRALAIIEREDEFAARATRWRFGNE